MSCQSSAPTTVSSAAKISSVAASITGVPVMPSGLMSPQPPDKVGAESTTEVLAGVPTCNFQITFPVLAPMA